MRAEGDAKGLVQMLVDHDAAFCERDTQIRGLDLEDKSLKGDCVIVTDSAFFFDGEDQIKIGSSPYRVGKLGDRWGWKG